MEWCASIAVSCVDVGPRCQKTSDFIDVVAVLSLTSQRFILRLTATYTPTSHFHRHGTLRYDLSQPHLVVQLSVA
eukprot:CAMPEP_0175834278 /NCGR_PEP_ID=MMETSP0107_2-20121207/15974_1 /TAXON_ID=195067 ORGANISM="Goniomonas pacifica, Strain CCMP1869" /NCGR_SAMPLE_ID=MMETSP0107_2 /ASSEMBLY_ACC=CAM_ASM_000203 /LENGTH=74 /DNA_ID=CAMNT_0017147495 /DNA_START=1070 /DNA_END=1291 /DNA_ORIENTATION=+